MVSPYGGPVTAGEPGIHVVPSCFGFSRSPLPALCRQATACAWRCRPRRITDRRSGCSRGRADVSSAGQPWAALTPQTTPNRNRTGHHGAPFPSAWAILAVHVAKLLPKKRAGIERRHAPNVTHTVVRRTNVPKVVWIIADLEHRVYTRQCVPKRSPPYVTHSVVSWTWAPFSASCCYKSVAVL